eukprot:TRINITY_DN6636_c0_g1_i1.p1 TRINITY_DN6636_c0_g1~~TRINITY_DN6636_c0_g1_i1.p1  ORF type:complete len:389 (-),score=74.70 TRINITY_DN6636_c0_g1_i1:411-1577(-)
MKGQHGCVFYLCLTVMVGVAVLPRTFMQSSGRPHHVEKLGGTSFLDSRQQLQLSTSDEQVDEATAPSWASALLALSAALGLVFGVISSGAKPAEAITAEQFSQLTWQQVRGSGLANRCPTVESKGTEVKVPRTARIKYMCFEPKSFAVEAVTEDGSKEFVTTRLLTGQTYTLDYVEGKLKRNPIRFSEEDGMDFQAVTVKLPDGEYVPFLFTVKQLQATGEGDSFKPGLTWGGQFEVPSYRTGAFLDSKGRGMYTGYDQAVALPALEADGRAGQEELYKAINKVFDTGKGAIEMEVSKVNEDLGEIGGVFVSKQPGDTDMGAKDPKTILLKGMFYGKVVETDEPYEEAPQVVSEEPVATEQPVQQKAAKKSQPRSRSRRTATPRFIYD